MTSRITLLSLVANNPDRVAAFWQAALGWAQVFRDDTGIDLADPVSGMGLEIARVDSPRTGKDRLHLDLRADGTTFADELDRLLPSAPPERTSGRPPMPPGRFWPTPRAMRSAFCAAPCRKSRPPAPDAGWAHPLTAGERFVAARAEPRSGPFVGAQRPILAMNRW